MGTNTTNYNLYKPDNGETGWGDEVNDSTDIVDGQMKTNADAIAAQASDVADNTTHRTSDGTDHADVGSNNTHRAGDGSDHADVATNTLKVTNATHSGDASGDTALTAQPAIITGKGAATVATGDLVLISDIDDSNNLKQVTAQSIANLAPGGVEINNLEVVTTGIATTEIPIGTAADTVVYAPLSGGATMANDGTVTIVTNANLTGVVTSVGNATAIADKALAIAKLADGTDGELITWDAAGVIAAVAAGTADQVLTSNGAGAAPTFQDAGGGGTSGIELFTSSGTFNVPAGVSTVYLSMVGGGGGGGDNLGGGGSSGAWLLNFPFTVTPSGSETVTIGTGGGRNTDGTSTSFGSITVVGGDGAVDGPSGAAGVRRGQYDASGGNEGTARVGSIGGTGTGSRGGGGGGTPFGDGGFSTSSGAPTNPDSSSGAGGAGGDSGFNGTTGADGLVIVMY